LAPKWLHRASHEQQAQYRNLPPVWQNPPPVWQNSQPKNRGHIKLLWKSLTALTKQRGTLQALRSKSTVQVYVSEDKPNEHLYGSGSRLVNSICRPVIAQWGQHVLGAPCWTPFLVVHHSSYVVPCVVPVNPRWVCEALYFALS
jgi:hypothetical protein